MDEFGHIAGMATLAVLLIHVILAFLRAGIGGAFRTVHRLGAALLVIFSATHGTLLYLDFGAPDSAWHACGSLGALLVFAALGAALARRRLGARFLPVHKVLGTGALGLALLHRIIPFV